MSFIVTKNTLTPALAKMARACSDPKMVLEAMGEGLVKITQRAFRDESLRASPWPAVKKTSGAPLHRHGSLLHSIRITGLTSKEVTVGTDRPYAVYHQFGTKPYTIRPVGKLALFWPGARHPVKKVNHPGLPPRPFFPFDAQGTMTKTAQDRIQAAAKVALARLLKP